MKKKMHFTIMGLVVAVLALALALTGCAKDASGNTNASTSESVDVNTNMQDQESHETLMLEGTVWRVETVSTSDEGLKDAVKAAAARKRRRPPPPGCCPLLPGVFPEWPGERAPAGGQARPRWGWQDPIFSFAGCQTTWCETS